MLKAVVARAWFKPMTDFDIYIASAYHNKLLVSAFVSCLDQYLPEVRVISRWHSLPGMPDLSTRARVDYADIDRAHLMLAIYPYGYGTTSEMGYALAKGIPIVYYRHPDQEYDDPLPVGMLEQFQPSYCPKYGIVAITFEEMIQAIFAYRRKRFQEWLPLLSMAGDMSKVES